MNVEGFHEFDAEGLEYEFREQVSERLAECGVDEALRETMMDILDKIHFGPIHQIDHILNMLERANGENAETVLDQAFAEIKAEEEAVAKVRRRRKKAAAA